MDRLIAVGLGAISGGTRRNSLLGGLPADEQLRIRDHFEPVRLDARSILHSPGRHIENVYFPLSGVLSLLAMDELSPAIEVGSIGNEGLSGLSAAHGVYTSTQQCMVQVAGEALRIPVLDLRRDLRSCPVLAARVLRYSDCIFNDVAQSVMCTRLHTARQRCARWLLLTHDRVNGGDMLVTHEFLSDLLAVRRSTVTVAMRGFRVAKIIDYRRGRVRVLDRPRLEAAACACYRVRRTAHDHVLAN